MTKRTNKVAGLIRHKLNEIICRQVEWPAGILPTITKIEVSVDLRYVKVWLAVTPVEETGVAYGILKKKKNILRKALGDALGLPVRPILNFRVDKNAAYVAEVEEIFKQIADEKK